jgi:hypothetical protein
MDSGELINGFLNAVTALAVAYAARTLKRLDADLKAHRKSVDSDPYPK